MIELELDVDCGVDDVLGNYDVTPLIILCKTGIWWTQQSGHHGCELCYAEGFVIHFGGECHRHCDWIQGYSDPEKDELINEIDKSLEKSDEKFRLVKKVRFDTERKSEFIEGWIPVNVWLGNALEPKKGILAIGNCD